MEADAKVVVEVRTDESGKLLRARAISGPLELGPPAERAARRRVYEPRMLNGVPVRVITTVTFRYAAGDVIAPIDRDTDTPRE